MLFVERSRDPISSECDSNCGSGMAETQEGEVRGRDFMEGEARLKYLGFFQVAVLKTMACLSSLYDYAKENSGPLKSGVDTVEQTVKTVVGPVYQKIEGKPSELLQFADRKVDETFSKVNETVPPTVKQRACQMYGIAKQASEIAWSVVNEVQRTGVIGTATDTTRVMYSMCEPTAKDFYAKYEPVAEEWALFVWRKLLKLPLVPQMIHILIPTATYWSEKYNHFVTYLSHKQFRIASYLPYIQVKKINKKLERELEGSKAKHG